MAGETVTNELMFETLEAIRGENARTNERLDRIERRLGSLEGHVAALVRTDMERNVDYDALARRVERIERRLELNEGNA